MSVCEIPLTRGLVARVDEEDFAFLIQWRWHAMLTRSGICYAVRKQSRTEVGPGETRKTFLMHREITGAPAGCEVDHKDHDGLNNTRKNLRVCRPIDNKRNGRKRRGPLSSRFKGVSWYSPTMKWRADISVNGTTKYIGYFETETEAAVAYNVAAMELYGEFAYINEV